MSGRGLNKHEIESRASGIWSQIIAHCACLPPDSLRPKKPRPCPGCGGKDRFTFDDKEGRGTFYCRHCGAGDGFKLIMICTGWTFAETLRAVADYVGVRAGSDWVPPPVKPAPRTKTEPVINERAAAQHQLLLSGSCSATPDTATYRYLTISRELPLLAIPEAIRHHPGVKFFDDNGLVGTYPAMIGIITGPAGNVVNLHVTYLTEDGRKAFGSDSRRLQTPIHPGATSGGAVRLFPAGETLGISEGIETGFAAHLMTGIPVWSAINEGCMRKVVIPPEVRKVIIFADNDRHGKGEQAATELAKRMQREQRSAEVRVPAEQGEDWLDVFNKSNRNVQHRNNNRPNA